MKRWRRNLILIVVCIGIFCPPEVAAQSFVDSMTAETVATPAQVRTLLESSDPREQAWGGWLAGTGKLTEMIPLLERVVSERLKDPLGQNELTRDVALDALIQLDARLAPDLLLTIYPRRPAQALILLSRIGSNGNDALLKLAEQRKSFQWYPPANLLLRNRAPGFAALLLRDMHISLTVFVVYPGRGTRTAGMRIVSGSCDVGRARPSAGFPPVPSYTLTHPPQPGAMVLGSGPKPVFYVREVFVAGGPVNPGARCAYDQPPTAADYLIYLAALAPKATISIRADESYDVSWSGSDALATSIESFREDIRKRYRASLQNLTADGLLTPDEASSLKNPNIDVQVQSVYER